MTLRTDHATTITPELGALAELIFLLEQLLEDGFQPTDDNKATFAAFDEAIEHGKQLVHERMRERVRIARDPGLHTAHVQLTMALGEARRS